MKTLLSLLLLLIPFTAFGQDIDQARWHLQQALEALSTPEQPIDSFSVVPESPNIFKAEWFSNQSGEGDIEYGTGGFQYSYQNNVSPIELQSNSVKIGVGRQGIWQFRFVTEDWVSDTLYADNRQNAPPEIQVWGWWDSMTNGQTVADYPFTNTIKTHADNVPQALSTDIEYVIPYIGIPDDFTENQLRNRLRNKGSSFRNEDDRIPFVILQDEPDGWDVGKMEMVIELAKEEISPELCYTYSFSGTHMLNERQLPQNTQCIHWNHYPFRGIGYPSGWGDVVTKGDFMRTFDRVVEIAERNSAEGTRFSITTQTFAQHPHPTNAWTGEWQWRPPPDESPLWYAEAMSRHGFIGGLHYLLRRSDADRVAEDMPGVMENIEEVFNAL